MTVLGQARSPRPDPKDLLARQLNFQIPDTFAATARMFGVCQIRPSVCHDESIQDVEAKGGQT
jgi:hypothetical protein